MRIAQLEAKEQERKLQEHLLNLGAIDSEVQQVDTVQGQEDQEESPLTDTTHQPRVTSPPTIQCTPSKDSVSQTAPSTNVHDPFHSSLSQVPPGLTSPTPSV